MDHQQQYCLKWSNYSSNLATAFSNLFQSETLTDVTLFCEGKFRIHSCLLICEGHLSPKVCQFYLQRPLDDCTRRAI